MNCNDWHGDISEADGHMYQSLLMMLPYITTTLDPISLDTVVISRALLIVIMVVVGLVIGKRARWHALQKQSH